MAGPRYLGQEGDTLHWQDDDGAVWGMPRGMWPQGTPLPSDGLPPAVAPAPEPPPLVPPAPPPGPSLFGVPQELLGRIPSLVPADAGPAPIVAPEPVAPPVTPPLPAPAPNAREQIQQSGDVIGESIERQGEMQAQAAAGKSKILDEAIARDQQAQADDEAWLAARNAEIDQRAANHRAEVAKLADLSTDPRKTLGDDTGSLLFRAAMGAIGGWLAPDNGGRNTALEMFDRIIQQRVQVQESNVANRRAALGEQGKLLSDDRAAVQDAARQRAVLRNAAWERTARMLEAQGLRLQPGVERENALQLAAEARAKGAQQLAAIEQDDRKLALDEWQTRQQVQLGWANLKAQKDAARAEAAGRGDAAEAERMGRTVDPLGFVARDAKQADEVGKMWAATKTLNQGMDELIKLRLDAGGGTDGGESLGGEVQNRLVAQGATLVAQVKSAEELGALDKGTSEFVEQMLGDPTAHSQNVVARVEQARKYINGKYRNRLEAVGFRDFKRIEDGWWRPKRPASFEEGGTVDTNGPRGRQAPAGLPPSQPPPVAPQGPTGGYTYKPPVRTNYRGSR